MIEFAITICALMFSAPYYDCSENWNIFIYNSSYNVVPGTESGIGTAVYNVEKGNSYIELVHDYKELEGKHDHMLAGGGVLWHEILHMMCECDWHENVDKKTDNNRLNNRRHNPTIYEEVKPYLKKPWGYR